MRPVSLFLVFGWLSVSFLYASSLVPLEQELAKAKNPEEKLELCLRISEYFREVNPQKSVSYGKKAAELANLLKDEKQLSTAYHDISIGYYWLNDLVKASEFTYNALRIRERLKDSVGLANSYNVLGNIHREQKHFDKAQNYFQKVLLLGRRLNRQETISIALNNIGTTYELSNQPQKALEYYLQVKEINKTNGDPFDQAVDELNLGNIYFILGEKEKALDHLNRSLDISTRIKNEINKIYVCRVLSQVYLQDKNYPQALHYAKLSLETAKSVPSPDGIQQAALLLNEIFIARHDYKNAHQYLALHTAYKDSMTTRQKAEAQEEMHTRYETEKKNAENRRLLMEQELQNERLTRKNIILFATCLLLVLAVALAHFAFMGRKKVKDANAKLNSFNQLILEKNKNIEEQKGELEKLNHQKDLLFSIIAHDLRSPLISLQSLLQLLSAGNLPKEKVDRFVQDLSTQQQNTIGLLDNLLVWAKIQMRGMGIKPSAVTIRNLVQQNIELLQPQAVKKDIVLLNNTSADLVALVDEETIKMVFRNLISNAIKYSHTGSLVEITGEPLAPDQLIFTVKDGGVGISPENQLKLFNANSLKEKGTANEKGNGLGLMLCKEFIEKNGGDIWVESELGVGTSFHFTVPDYLKTPVPSPLPASEQKETIV